MTNRHLELFSRKFKQWENAVQECPRKTRDVESAVFGCLKLRPMVPLMWMESRQPFFPWRTKICFGSRRSSGTVQLFEGNVKAVLDYLGAVY